MLPKYPTYKKLKTLCLNYFYYTENMQLNNQDKLIRYVSKKLNNLKVSYEMRGYVTLIDNALDSSKVLSKYLIEWFGVCRQNIGWKNPRANGSHLTPPKDDIEWTSELIDKCFEEIESELKTILQELLLKIQVEMKKNIYIKMCNHCQTGLFQSLSRTVQEQIEKEHGIDKTNLNLQMYDSIVSDMIKNIADRRHTYQLHIKRHASHIQQSVLGWSTICSDLENANLILQEYYS